MSTLAIDTYRLLTALKGTGKSANFTAEEIAGAVHVAQQGGDLLTKAEFGVRMDAFEKRMDAFEKRMDAFEKRMDAFDARMDAFDARMDAFVERMDAFVARLVAMEDRFDAKLEEVRADLRADIKASQTQNLLWLSGLVLASNGMVIALLARLAHVI
jgi:chaperonin cofactor prefoldin